MSDVPKNPGLDGRGREKSGQIDHKHPPPRSSTCASITAITLPLIGTASALSVSYSRRPSLSPSANTSNTTVINR